VQNSVNIEAMERPLSEVPTTQIPFFRPELSEGAVNEVVATLRSGWLTSGPKVKQFERDFATAVGASYAVAVNSCTAALHLALDALGLQAGQGVLVPTMTFAATAEVIRYFGAIPILVDCDSIDVNMSLVDAKQKLDQLETNKLQKEINGDMQVVGIIPVHVGGLMMNMEEVENFSIRRGLWVVEDAAHAFPAAWRNDTKQPWRRCGENTAAVSCFSFYANKTITTGEGGMATTSSQKLSERMRLMSLHGLSHDAWERYSGGGNWDYQIVEPGFKYNLTDIAAAIGIHQVACAEQMRRKRERIAQRYLESLRDVKEIELPPQDPNRIHSWHLFPIKLRLNSLTIDRNTFLHELKQAGIGASVHWRPLHLHPYYQDKFGWRAEDFPVATSVWKQLISLPLFPGLREGEVSYVVRVIKDLCRHHRR
jgi:perosamine synthetase